MTSVPIESVVADANVLLSAVTGKAALRVIIEFAVDVHVAEFNVAEVFEYLPFMAKKYRIEEELLLLQWKLIPLKVHPQSDYQSLLEQATMDLAKRDPEDAHPLALARQLEMPLWSNDRDLVGHGVECFPTARLLATLQKHQGSPT